MGKTKVVSSSGATRRMRPALTPEARENQMISLAMDVAEERLRNGTASSQEIVHFLKLGSSREKYEQEKIALENELVKAKTEAVASAKDVKEMYDQAMASFRRYSGQEDDEDEY